LTAGRLYRFVQFEFPWPLGPPDGRYLLRDHAGEEPHHVLVIAGWETTAQARPRRWGRDPEARRVPAETGLTRATLVDPAAVDEAAARAWLDQAAGAGAEATVRDGLRGLNGALRAYRAAAADPAVHDADASRALVVRAGYGVGYEVADGDWSAARELAATSDERRSRRVRREAALRPQERLAALLGGRDAVLVCEEMALRARQDLDHGRQREAALQAHLALEAAVAELQAFSGTRSVAERLPDLQARRDALAAGANEALQGGPSEATMAAVADGLDRIEAALRARAASGSY
jgi:hypothetical protein